MRHRLLHLAYTNLKYCSASQISIKPDFPTAAHCLVSVACLLVILTEPSRVTTSVGRCPKPRVPVLCPAADVALHRGDVALEGVLRLMEFKEGNEDLIGH